MKNIKKEIAKNKNKTCENLYQKIIFSYHALKNSSINSAKKNKKSHKLERTHGNLFFLHKKVVMKNIIKTEKNS